MTAQGLAHSCAALPGLIGVRGPPACLHGVPGSLARLHAQVLASQGPPSHPTQLALCCSSPADPFCGRARHPLLPLRKVRVQLARGLMPFSGGRSSSKAAMRQAAVSASCPAAGGPGGGACLRRVRLAAAVPPCTLRRALVRRRAEAPAARSHAEERTHEKAASAQLQLEVLKRERMASQQLRAELDARCVWGAGELNARACEP